MKEIVVIDFKSLRTVNLTSKTKNIAEGRKCTKKRNWKHYWIKIRAKRKKNNTIDNTPDRKISTEKYKINSSILLESSSNFSDGSPSNKYGTLIRILYTLVQPKLQEHWDTLLKILYYLSTFSHNLNFGINSVIFKVLIFSVYLRSVFSTTYKKDSVKKIFPAEL